MVDYRKRLMSYIIDIIIVFIFITLVNYFIKVDSTKLNDLKQLNDSIRGSLISLSEYFHKYADIIKSIDTINIFKTVINSIIIFGYFLIVPFINKGSTIGQHIFKIKVVDELGGDVTLIGLIRKNLIINGLAYTIITIIMLFFLPSFYYFIGISLLGLIQIIVVIISAFMVIYRRDKKGLQDIFSYTMIIEK